MKDFTHLLQFVILHETRKDFEHVFVWYRVTKIFLMLSLLPQFQSFSFCICQLAWWIDDTVNIYLSVLNCQLKVVGKPGRTVKRICGVDILDNNGVNFVSILLTTLLTSVACVYIFWDSFDSKCWRYYSLKIYSSKCWADLTTHPKGRNPDILV